MFSAVATGVEVTPVDVGNRDHHLKLHRARRHLKEAMRVFQDYLIADPLAFDSEIHLDGRLCRTWVTGIKEVPRVLGTILGDAVHNLRSSLDAAVYALAEHQSKTPLSPKEALRSQFPIVDDSEKWRDECDYRLDKIDMAGRQAIESLQPFRNPESSLSVLQKLSNSDKHRRIAVMLMVPEIVCATLFVDGKQNGTLWGPPFATWEPGVIIAEWSFQPETFSPSARIDVFPLAVPGLQLDRRLHGENTEVFRFLSGCIREVHEVVHPMLDRLLAQ